MNPVFVTGAAGFVGGAMVRALAGGGMTVRAGVRRIDGRPCPDGVEPVLADVLDRGALEQAFAGCDAVVHCAIGGPRDTRVITEGTANALAAASVAGVTRFIHLSSVAVYGDRAGEFDEGAATSNPAGAYGRAKVEAEQACAAAPAGMAVAVLRPTLIYGPGSDQWVVRYLDRILSGRWGRLGAAGDGDCNLIHVDDLAAFARHLTVQGWTGYRVFNVNGTQIPTWNRYLEGLADALGAPLSAGSSLPGGTTLALRKLAKAALAIGSRAGVEVAPLRRWVDHTPSADEVARFSRKVRYPCVPMAETGFLPAISLDEGLAGIAAWHRAGRPRVGWS